MVAPEYAVMSPPAVTPPEAVMSPVTPTVLDVVIGTARATFPPFTLMPFSKIVVPVYSTRQNQELPAATFVTSHTTFEVAPSTNRPAPATAFELMKSVDGGY